MLPVTCQGFLYTPRLLAVMLLLARHPRLVDKSQAAGPADKASAIDSCYSGEHVAEAVCEGHAQGSSVQAGLQQRSGMRAATATDPARQTSHDWLQSKIADSGSRGATAQQQPATCSDKLVDGVSDGTAGLSVRSAFYRARQRVLRDRRNSHHACCGPVSDHVETRSRLLQQCSPEVAAS